MSPAGALCLVLVTAPDFKSARKLARLALTEHLVACANLVPAIESHYWWQGKLESGKEILIIYKTTKAHLPALEKLVVANHPYDTPEVLALPLHSGNKRYCAWLFDSVKKKTG